MKPSASLFGALLLVSCHTAGKDWINQPLPGAEDPWADPPGSPPPPAESKTPRRSAASGAEVQAPQRAQAEQSYQGRVLGSFRNTYYDFPHEKDFGGEKVKLMSVDCHEIGTVALEFHDAICVQGSGMMANGTPVSFARRDCECARLCPRTQQHICFEAVDPKQFPWGRGALGQPITPLRTAAVDDSIIPMGTVMYIPDFDGMPSDVSEQSTHDGCFVAEDRGLKVKGKHVDIFTGHASMTRLWNERVPSNQGVTVVLDSPRCSRLVKK